jgi:8-oxo-dGTP pyrophosphatase MutT (NUDIX family)
VSSNDSRRDPVLRLLREYRGRWPQEASLVDRFERFVREQPACLERACIPGHLTGSALVADPVLEHVLLTHHRKLDKWLQLGGHADGDPHLEQVAAREAREESGLERVTFCECVPLLGTRPQQPVPFDLDVHVIPARGKEPEHLHWDVRFLLCADRLDAIHMSEESHALRWFTLEEARAITDEPSMRRQFEKVEHVRRMLIIRKEE